MTLALILGAFALATFITHRIAPALGYHSFGGEQASLFVIRFFTWATFCLGAFGIGISALAAAFVPDLGMGATLGALAGVMLGLALHGPTAKSAKG